MKNRILRQWLRFRGQCSFLTAESGATAIEYGLIAAGIAMALLAVLITLGNEMNDYYQAILNRMTGASNSMK